MSRGWFFNSEGHARAGRLGGSNTLKKYGNDFFKKIGSIGGSRKKIKKEAENEGIRENTSTEGTGSV